MRVVFYKKMYAVSMDWKNTTVADLIYHTNRMKTNFATIARFDFSDKMIGFFKWVGQWILTGFQQRWLPKSDYLFSILAVSFSWEHIFKIFYNRNCTNNETYSSNRKGSTTQHNNHKLMDNAATKGLKLRYSLHF
jgi:hypothetical protein